MLRPLHLGTQRFIAQRMADLRDIDNRAQLLGTQQRHGGHGNATSLDNAKPGRHHHRVIGRAQQHAVARLQAQGLRQYIGNAVGLVLQVSISPAQAFGLYAQALSTAFAHMLVQQLHRAVQSLGKLQLWQLKNELGLQRGRRQIVGCKGIDMRAV